MHRGLLLKPSVASPTLFPGSYGPRIGWINKEKDSDLSEQSNDQVNFIGQNRKKLGLPGWDV